MPNHKRRNARWIVIDNQTERPLAVVEGYSWHAAQDWCQIKYGTTARLTSWRHASDNQRSIAGRLPVTPMEYSAAEKHQRGDQLAESAERLQARWKGQSAGGGA